MPLKLKKTKNQDQTIAQLHTRIHELEENWKRALADYQNLEKRHREQQETSLRLVNTVLITNLLGILDDLERAKTHLQDEGLSLIIGRFNEVLASEGINEVKTRDEEFDPRLMECIEMSPGEKNRVLGVQVKGYTLNGSLIRPAKVIVGKGK